jgi:hypothetical protein
MGIPPLDPIPRRPELPKPRAPGRDSLSRRGAHPSERQTKSRRQVERFALTDSDSPKASPAIWVSQHHRGALLRELSLSTRIGIDVSRATLAAWMIKMGELVGLLINLMCEELLESGFVQCDESRYQVLKETWKDSRESVVYLGTAGHGSWPPAHSLRI